MAKPLESSKPESTAKETPAHKKVDRIAEDAAKAASVTEKKYKDKQDIFTK